MAGDFDDIAEPCPIGFHNYAYTQPQAPYTKVFATEVHRDICKRLKSALVVIDNIDGGLSVLKEAEVGDFSCCVMFDSSVQLCFRGQERRLAAVNLLLLDRQFVI
jgi:hypothetical protein